MTESVEPDRSMIDAFFDYIVGIEAEDDRYGGPTRHDRPDGTLAAVRFDCGPSQWLEVAVIPDRSEIRIGFVTGNAAIRDEIAEGIKESGASLQQHVESAFADAGLRWPEPPVEHYQDEDGQFYYTTSLALEYFEDVDRDEVRDKAVRMLEGFLLAFGSAIELDGEDLEEHAG